MEYLRSGVRTVDFKPPARTVVEAPTGGQGTPEMDSYWYEHPTRSSLLWIPACAHRCSVNAHRFPLSRE